MNSIITVTTAATNRALVTLDQVKLELGIADTASDDLLEIYRARVSQAVASDCGREFARDVVSQQFTLHSGFVGGFPHGGFQHGGAGSLNLSAEYLILGHAFPCPEPTADYCTISSVTEDGLTVDPGDYELDAEAGLLYRLLSGLRISWAAAKTVVVFTAGYVMPDDGNSTLPAELSGAAVELIKASKFAQSRDPALRSEDILSGLYSYTLFDPSRPDSAWPVTVTDILDKYRNHVIA